jgi:hypothetical protein
MANHKRKKFRWAGKTPLNCKYWHRGMAKTNYRYLSRKWKPEAIR